MEIQYKSDASYLFKFLLVANMCLYLEAGAIPAMLIQIADAFQMSPGLQGILGGIAYLSLGFGSPFAGYLMRNYNHKVVLGYAIGINSTLTLIWSLTPVGRWYSSIMFIIIRFLMGLMQCVVCVFLPLWTNEFAPSSERTKWMGGLQASVPFGVMGGYIIAAVMIGPIKGTDTCYGILCWRWPLLVEWLMLVPFAIAIHFVPENHLIMKIGKGFEVRTQRKPIQITSEPSYIDLEKDIPSSSTYQDEKSDIFFGFENIESRNQHDDSNKLTIINKTINNNCDDNSNNNTNSNTNDIYLNLKTPLRKYKQRQYSSMGEVEIGKLRLSPQAEELQRRSWHEARRHSMTASLYSSYSLGAAFQKSPSDIEQFSSLVGDNEFADSISGYGSLSLDEVEMEAQNDLDEGNDNYNHVDNDNDNEEEKEEEETEEQRRKRLDSEIVEQIENFDYSTLREIMDGTKSPPIQNENLLSTLNSIQQNSKKEYPLEYESLSSVIKKTNHPNIISVESMDDWVNLDGRDQSERHPSRNFNHQNSNYTLNQVDTEHHLPGSLHPSRATYSMIKEQDSDVESESDAYAHLFEPVKSPVKRQSLKFKDSAAESSSYLGKLSDNVLYVGRNIISLIKIPVYRYLLFTLTSLYFVVTGVQFWGTSYMLLVLSTPQSYVNIMFVLCAGTGPTFGVFFGGYIIDKMGGYIGQKQRVISLRVCLCTGILAGVFATIGSFVTDFVFFIICLWLILFFGASLLPSCTGILVSIVPRKYRPISSSLSIFIFNIFGYSFSLLLSGYLMELINRFYPSCDMICSRRLGFRLVLLWSYWSLFFLLLAYLSAVQYEKKKTRT